MPASRTLIFHVEIRGYIALGNSVGNMNCTLRRLQCENSDTGLNDGHAFTLLAASQNRRRLCLIVKGREELILQQQQQNPTHLPARSVKYLFSTRIGIRTFQLAVLKNQFYFQHVQTHTITKFTPVHAKRKFSIFPLLGDTIKASKMPHWNIINLTVLICFCVFSLSLEQAANRKDFLIYNKCRFAVIADNYPSITYLHLWVIYVVRFYSRLTFLIKFC